MAGCEATLFGRFRGSHEIVYEEMSRTFCNGGIQIHKYRIEGAERLEWFAGRDRLREIDFVKNVITHSDLARYRKDLGIAEDKLHFQEAGEIQRYWGGTDILPCPGN